MNRLERDLRAYALRYPEAHEDFPWGDRVIKVRGKIFAFLGMLDDDVRLGVKLTHSNAAVLALPYVEPMGYGMARSGWVTIRITKGARPPRPDLLKAWIDESYRAVAPKTLVGELRKPTSPARRRAEIGGSLTPDARTP